MFKEEWIIYKVKSGSQAYGTATLTSDTDYKGIAIPDIEYYLTPFKKFEQHETKNPDCAIYEFNKFIKLAADCNPNIIEVLNVDESDVIIRTNISDILRRNAGLFLSAKAKHTFSGYSHSQIQRIKNHKEWIDNPPPAPVRGDYHLPEGRSLMSHDEINKLDKEFGFNKDKNPSSDTRELIARKYGEEKASNYYYEKKYRIALRNYQQYGEWKQNRNRDRYEVESKFGFDTKHANHAVRLSRMCKEILTQGKVIVKRPDAEELLEIRNGLWSYDKVIGEVESLEKECNEIYEDKSYIVPHKPDIGKIEELCMGIMLKHKDLIRK